MNPQEPTRECRVDWSRLVPDEDWHLYGKVLEAADQRGIAYALGGGLAFSEHAGRARNTKDLDLYILPKDRESMIAAVLEAGYHDYYEEKPYDRSWIFRSTRDDVIVDIIWTTPNHRMDVDEAWLTDGPSVLIRDRCVRLIPAEELIWAKLYVLQRDRCDWPDLLNILSSEGPDLDWDRLIERVGKRDAPLLGGLLSTYRWMRPEDASLLPHDIWTRVGLMPPETAPSADEDEERAPVLDSRDWFGPKAA